MKGLTTQAEKCTLSPSTADMLTIAAYKYKNMEETRLCLHSVWFCLMMTKGLWLLGVGENYLIIMQNIFKTLLTIIKSLEMILHNFAEICISKELFLFILFLKQSDTNHS